MPSLGCRTREFYPQTITAPAALRNELDQVRAQGWAVSNQEWDVDMTAIGVPLRGLNDTVIAALTITGFTHDLPEKRSQNAPQNFKPSPTTTDGCWLNPMCGLRTKRKTSASCQGFF